MDAYVVDTNPLFVKNTPLPGYTLPNFLSLLAHNTFQVSLRYIPRFTYCITMSTIMAPFYIKERLQYDVRIRATEISKAPLFILGHWRSGTTYLHNVLAQDKNLGYFTTFQAYLPGVFLTSEKLFKPLVSSSIPKKRPMDNVEMNADFPQEDSYALGAFSPYSYYHGWCFPKKMEFFERYVCMDDVSQAEIDNWKKTYIYLLKKITLREKGKQLVLKNQDNTGKVKLLLELFPNAKFIFLYRNPYTLYYSMMKFMRIAVPRYCIQTPPPIHDLERSMMSLYSRIMRKYLNDRRQIPSGNLIEIRYEDYLKNPARQLKDIYATLKLSGYTNAKPAFSTYIASQDKVKYDQYTISDTVKKKVEKEWGFALKEFGYEP
jgi:hypothetical protein